MATETFGAVEAEAIGAAGTEAEADGAAGEGAEAGAEAEVAGKEEDVGASIAGKRATCRAIARSRVRNEDVAVRAVAVAHASSVASRDIGRTSAHSQVEAILPDGLAAAAGTTADGAPVLVEEEEEATPPAEVTEAGVLVAVLPVWALVAARPVGATVAAAAAVAALEGAVAADAEGEAGGVAATETGLRTISLAEAMEVAVAAAGVIVVAGTRNPQLQKHRTQYK